GPNFRAPAVQGGLENRVVQPPFRDARPGQVQQLRGFLVRLAARQQVNGVQLRHGQPAFVLPLVDGGSIRSHGSALCRFPATSTAPTASRAPRTALSLLYRAALPWHA